MVDERTVYDVLAPVRAYVTNELGVAGNWRHWVGKDIDGHLEIFIWLDVFPNQNITAEIYAKIDAAVWETIRGNRLTEDYFPYVQYNALRGTLA